MERTKDMEKSLQKILIMAIVCFVISLASLFFYFCYRVEPITETIVVELGDAVSENYADYVTGMEWSVAHSKLDLSQVKADTVGEYEAYLIHGGQKFCYNIVIQDTTAPVITLSELPIYLKLGEKYSGRELIASVEDVSGDVVIRLGSAEGKVTSDEANVYFGACGKYTVEVVAEDASGNITSQTVSVIVDTPPVIEGTESIYIAIGSAEDNPKIESEDYYLEGVTAVDDVDGDLSNKVEVNLAQLDIDTPGVYEIIYTVTDSYGLTTETTVTVEILDKDELQEMINTHEISRHNSRISGAYNPYDGGYYEEDDVELIREIMEPAFVQIKPNENSHGSGFIIEITEEYVLVCTNQHVVGKKDEVKVYFHNGEWAYGETIGTDRAIDIALVQIPMVDVSEELLDTLKTVHINMGYWEAIEASDHISICMRCINDDGSVWKEREGTLISKRDDPTAGSWSDMTQLGWSSFSGCSGSAILDGHGNLIAMARGRVRVNENGSLHTTAWGVHLLDIVEFYEATMGKPIYYH